jgi:YidC/Oxa1 family membrane protein insertase
MQQKRLVLALLISTAVLFGWNYFFPIKGPQPAKPGTTAAASPTSSASANTPAPTPVASAQQPAPSPTSETVHQRNIVIKTPLYEATLDSHGAVVVSWILTKNRDNNQDLHSVGGNKKNPVRLELVSQEGLKHEPREAPLEIVTGDAVLDNLLSVRNYQVEGYPDTGGNVELNLSAKEKKRLSFTLRDSASNLEVTKSITFDADSYATDLEVKVRRGDQSLPQVKVQVGPSTGDQGVKHYTFYSVAPEGVAAVGDKIERHTGASINENKSSPDHLALNGPVDWAGVCDTYFAMVIVPSRHVEGLEYQTSQYDWKVDGKPEKRYLTRALVPVPADGSHSVFYVGPKDHYILEKASREIGGAVARNNLDLEGLINYGFGGSISRPIAERLLWCIKKLYQLTGSYGVAIILFTIIIYSAFFPLKVRSSKAMKKAQKLAPQMKELQEKIKGMKQSDPRLKDLQMEQLRLMKEGNPLGGCLPLLIQMPFLFALYRAITISLDFRQASFLWLPDLSAPEPYLIHVLPILMAGTMIVLQLITPAPSADPLQRKMMAIGMPLFMLYILWAAPAGLLVYWLVGNIVGFSQQFIINKWTQTDDDKSPPPDTSPPKSLGKKARTAKLK